MFSLCSVQHPFFFSPSFLLFFFSGQRPFLLQPSFLFSVSALPSALASLLFSSPLFLFFRCVALYFSAQNTFSAQTFFSPKTLFSAQNVFSVQRHSSLLLFSALFFSGSALFFLFQCLLFFFSLTSFIRDPIFSLAASNLFYLNKSLFSSNLE